RPLDRRRIGALSGEKEAAKAGEVVTGEELRVGILALDGAEGGRRGEERLHPVIGDDPPEGARVRRADGLSFVEDGRAALKERCVDDVRMPDDPTDVGGRPEDVSGVDV